MEDELRSVPVQGDSFQFEARGYEIKTFKLNIKPMARM
jgi:hypothetical protein